MGRDGELSSTNRKPDSPRARPGHRAVSIRMDCVLVSISHEKKRKLLADKIFLIYCGQW